MNDRKFHTLLVWSFFFFFLGNCLCVCASIYKETFLFWLWLILIKPWWAIMCFPACYINQQTIKINIKIPNPRSPNALIQIKITSALRENILCFFFFFFSFTVHTSYCITQVSLYFRIPASSIFFSPN